MDVAVSDHVVKSTRSDGRSRSEIDVPISSAGCLLLVEGSRAESSINVGIGFTQVLDVCMEQTSHDSAPEEKLVMPVERTVSKTHHPDYKMATQNLPLTEPHAKIQTVTALQERQT